MPPTLVKRIGPDTLGKLELAARRRYAEARRLVPDEPLGAIYLFGYTVEIRLKAAYYRTVGLIPTTPILLFHRQTAEKQIRTLLGIGGPVGHNLHGWASLLEYARANTPGAGVTPMPVVLAQKMHFHVGNLQDCWTEVLRYHANKPYDEEMRMVKAGAAWFKVNGRLLWS